MPTVDTSIVLRLLTMDDEKKARRFLKYLKTNQVLLADMVFAEIAWTLLRYYKFSKDQVLSGLRTLVTNSRIKCNQELLEKTLDYYEKYNIKFIDCYLAATARQSGNGQILSFDKDFDKIPGVKRLEP